MKKVPVVVMIKIDSGDKSLDTTQVITLNSVPPAKMGESETKYFQQVSM